MKKGDEEHQQLIFEAGKHRLECNTCSRHHTNTLPYPNPDNLLRHLMSAHGYQAKRWWEFWK